MITIDDIQTITIDIDEDRLSNFFIEFYERFKKKYTGELNFYESTENDMKRITIPAPNSDFGKIVILFEETEITVFAGDFFHHHFGIFDFLWEEDLKTAMKNYQTAVDEIFEFLDPVFADQLMIVAEFDGDRLVASGVQLVSDYQNELDSNQVLDDYDEDISTKQIKRFSWSKSYL